MQKKFIINGEETSFDLLKENQESIHIKLNGEEFHFSYQDLGEEEYILENSSQLTRGFASGNHITIEGVDFLIESARASRKGKKGGGDGNMRSPMPGKILKYFVKEGQEVVEGEALLVMEAMKMEHTIKASSDGTVQKVLFKEGQLVDGGIDLVGFLPKKDA